MEFKAFSKIPRLNRDIIITEKIDGTNGLIYIDETGKNMLVGSRTRWITPEADNYGFARWARDNESDLLLLGPGFHYGEYWGQGIQRKYGLTEKRFSLFNVHRWIETPEISYSGDSGVMQRIETTDYTNRKQPPKVTVSYLPGPTCCHVVPTLYTGPFDSEKIAEQLLLLTGGGSKAAPGFMNPEGIVVYHTAARQLFKVTVEHDEAPKSFIGRDGVDLPTV
jgi:hypothetical protein